MFCRTISLLKMLSMMDNCVYLSGTKVYFTDRTIHKKESSGDERFIYFQISPPREKYSALKYRMFAQQVKHRRAEPMDRISAVRTSTARFYMIRNSAVRSSTVRTKRCIPSYF